MDGTPPLDARKDGTRTVIGTDRRRLVAGSTPAAHARLMARRAVWMELQIELARAFGEVEMRGGYLALGSASFAEYAVRLGYDTATARQLADLGWALAHVEGLEDRLREGRIPVPHAAALGVLWRRGVSPRPGDDWLTAAAEGRLRDLRRRIQRRVAEHEQREARLFELTVFLTDAGVQSLDRARDIASTELGRPASDDHTVRRALDHFVASHGTACEGARPRRVGPTGGRPRSRYVPAEVRRALRTRSGGRCEVRTCQHRIRVEVCHLQPHAQGGDREVTNLVHLCHRHHVLLDAGRLRFHGFDATGHPRIEPRTEGPDPPGGWPIAVRDRAWARPPPGRARALYGPSPGPGP